MTKVVINSCFGGFDLSARALVLGRQISGNPEWGSYDTPRDDGTLIAVVEQLGADAGSNVSRLEIVTIPDDVEWQIEEYDGNEWVAEKHRTWR